MKIIMKLLYNYCNNSDNHHSRYQTTPKATGVTNQNMQAKEASDIHGETGGSIKR